MSPVILTDHSEIYEYVKNTEIIEEKMEIVGGKSYTFLKEGGSMYEYAYFIDNNTLIFSTNITLIEDLLENSDSISDTLVYSDQSIIISDSLISKNEDIFGSIINELRIFTNNSPSNPQVMVEIR